MSDFLRVVRETATKLRKQAEGATGEDEQRTFALKLRAVLDLVIKDSGLPISDVAREAMVAAAFDLPVGKSRSQDSD